MLARLLEQSPRDVGRPTVAEQVHGGGFAGADVGRDLRELRGDVASEVPLQECEGDWPGDLDAEHLHRDEVVGVDAVRRLGAVAAVGEALEPAAGVPGGAAWRKVGA